jgi:xanthine dehydrogenase YagS FAD-binding subunit
MKDFTFQPVAAAIEAASVVAARPQAMFLAGGTTLVDLMKVDVLTPDIVVDVRRLGLSNIDVWEDSITIGAAVTNSQLAWHPDVRDRLPVLSEAILAGATTQIRNMATVAGNMLQRTRCPYFRDVHASCNRRQPGSGCDALDGFNRGHAVLGVSEHCIATHPSDMCVAMVVLDAEIHTVRANGTTRSIPFRDFHLAPGDTPHVEVALEHGELITHVVIPHLPAARRSHYLKVRDRASYEFALVSAAVVLDLDGETIRAARLGLGGVATRPWRATEAELSLTGREVSDDAFRDAAEIALAGAVAREHNHFKIELGKRTIVRAFGSRRLVRVGVGYRRALVRGGHRSNRAAGEKPRARGSAVWPAVVQQCTTRLLSTGRGALRLGCAQSKTSIDAERGAARRIWHGTSGAVGISTSLQSPRIDTARWNRLRSQRRDRYRARPLHRDVDARI